jgi:hypothetical protein
MAGFAGRKTMFERLPIEIQVYLFSLLFGSAAPLLIYWMLRPALGHFLAAIFGDRRIEAFWLRLIVLVLLLAGLSAAVRYRPDSGVLADSVALVFSLADSVQGILEVLLYALVALFLPLLATYTVLFAAGRGTRSGPSERG